MIHTLDAQKKLRAASKRAHGQESLVFASRLEEQSGSGRGREQRMLILRGCKRPGPDKIVLIVNGLQSSRCRGQEQMSVCLCNPGTHLILIILGY